MNHRMLNNVLLLRVAKPKNWTTLRGLLRADLTERIRRHNSGDSKATKHGVPWIPVHSESFPLAPKQHNANNTTKRDEGGMNSTKAVAAAKGRRFKSSRPTCTIVMVRYIWAKNRE
jgi:hypothetical protein